MAYSDYSQSQTLSSTSQLSCSHSDEEDSVWDQD